MDGGRAPKRQRSNTAQGRNTRDEGYEIRSRVDPTTGQRGAFPGLDDEDNGDDDFYAPAQDGLEYLRMVRAEAQAVPSVLIARPRPQEGTESKKPERRPYEDKDFDKLWADEAVVATPTEGTDEADDEDDYEEEQDPQEAYYAALLERFGDLRYRFRNNVVSTSSTTSKTTSNAESQCATDPHAKYKQWWFAFTNYTPTASHVSQLSHVNVILGLERLETILTRRNLDISFCRANIGAWSWALLAKCRDRSEVDGDDVGVLRALAKKAQMLHRKYHALSNEPGQSMLSEDDEAEKDEEDGYEPVDAEAADHEADSEALEAARAKLLGRMDSEVDESLEAVENMDETDRIGSIFMLLDSIVTVVGELYGQRDLLEQRAAW